MHEVRGRLRQMEWAHSRMLALEAELESAARRARASDTPPTAQVLLVFTDAARPDCESFAHAAWQSVTADELRVLLEAYYYSAHRIRDIVRDNRDDLPGLSSFEATGVRNVRNHLIEHPTKRSGILVFSFKCGGAVGPQLKPLRWSLDGEGTHDEGLHKNTAEFLSSLAAVLSRALAEGSAQTRA